MSGNHPQFDEAGDIVFEIHASPDKILRRENANDIVMKQTISLVSALIGYSHTLEWINGKTYEINIPQITPGLRHVINNAGFNNTGNLIIEFDIEFPNTSEWTSEKKKYILAAFAM